MTVQHKGHGNRAGWLAVSESFELLSRRVASIVRLTGFLRLPWLGGAVGPGSRCASYECPSNETEKVAKKRERESGKAIFPPHFSLIAAFAEQQQAWWRRKAARA